MTVALKDSGVLRDILYARYGVIPTSSVIGGNTHSLRSVSPWWRGVSLISSKIRYSLIGVMIV